MQAAAAAERFDIGRLLVRQQARVLVRQQLLEWASMQLLGSNWVEQLWAAATAVRLEAGQQVAWCCSWGFCRQQELLGKVSW